MKGSIVFFLAACALTQASPSPSRIATIEDFDSRIISGWPAQTGQFPHQVHLWMITLMGGVSSCGGSFIHPQWILTAAHCLTDKTAVIVRYGAVNITEPGLILLSTNFEYHPGYDPRTLNHDVGLINVARQVTPTDLIKPIRVAGRDSLDVTHAGVVATVSGYGRTANTGSASETLNFVNLTIIGNTACSSIYGSIIIDSTICAVGLDNTAQSTCNGDSGGPLVVYEEDGDPTLIGVVSFVSSAGCDADHPSGYVRPQFYHDWLTQVTGIEF